MLQTLIKTPLHRIFIIAALPLVLSALFNPGFIASDEYWTAITRYIPAQDSSVQTLLAEDDVKAPLQLLPQFLLAQGFWRLGVEHPYWQYRLTVGLIALLGVFLLLAAARRFDEDETRTKLTLLLFGFYFAAPVLLTRPMFESMAAPFLAWAALSAVRYDQRAETKDLLWGAFFAAMAFAVRPQAGICALAFPLLALWKKDGKGLLMVSLWGALLIALTGLPDLWIRGSWHHSLIQLLVYNVEHQGDYNVQPFYYYLPLLFGMFFGPWLFARYDEETRSLVFGKLRSLWLMIALFVLQHSVFAHKYERFLFPLIPLILFLLAPLLLFFLRDRRKIRVGSLLVFNFLLWVPATFAIPQGHLISWVRFVDGRPDVETVFNLSHAMSWAPEVFRADGKKSRLQDMTLESLQAEGLPCGSWVVAHEPFVDEIQTINPDFQVQARFRPGLIEFLAFKLNPENNLRRAPLVMMNCPSQDPR